MKTVTIVGRYIYLYVSTIGVSLLWFITTPGQTTRGHRTSLRKWKYKFHSRAYEIHLSLLSPAQRATSLALASVATSGAGRRCVARASTRLACAHPRLHNRPPTPRAVPRAPRPASAPREIGSVRRTARARRTPARSCGTLGYYAMCARPTFPC